MPETAPSLLGQDLCTALHGDMVPKFLATQDARGHPNVVPIISLDAADDRTLIFAELFIWKTRDNLETDPRVSVAVVSDDLRTWTIRGHFRGFVEGGPHVDQMNRKEMFRYNAYVGVRRVGVIDVEAITADRALSRFRLAGRIMASKLVSRVACRRGSRTLPPRVAEKFARSAAVKVIAFQTSTGHPHVVPVFSLVPTRSESLVFGFDDHLSGLDERGPGARVSAAVITMDPIAYQVKGAYLGRRLTPVGRIGVLRCDEVYSASPPLPGQRIDLREHPHPGR
jgi:hypothetical protein